MNLDPLTLAALILGLLGAIPSFWLLKDWYSKRVVKWRSVEKAVFDIQQEMARDGFSPTLIVGIGRGGAIVGAMISGAFGHRPLMVIDRKYMWKDGRRIDDLYIRIKMPKSLIERVLLVSGEVHTGNTMRLYYDHFKSLGSSHIRRATFYYEIGATERVDYIGMKSSKKNLKMPWMFTNQYVRQDRSEEEAKGLHLLREPSEIDEETKD